MANPNPNRELDKLVAEMKDVKKMSYEQIGKMLKVTRARAFQRYHRHKKTVDNS